MITFRTALKAVAAYLLAHPGHTHRFTSGDLAAMRESPATLEQWSKENGFTITHPADDAPQTWRVHAPA